MAELLGHRAEAAALIRGPAPAAAPAAPRGDVNTGNTAAPPSPALLRAAMPPRRLASEKALIHAGLSNLAGAQVLALPTPGGDSWQLLWAPSTQLQSNARGTLAAAAAARLLALWTASAVGGGGGECGHLCVAADDAAAQQAAGLKIAQLSALDVLAGQYEAQTTNHINHSDAVFDLDEPPFASCGAETTAVTFSPQLARPQVGAGQRKTN